MTQYRYIAGVVLLCITSEVCYGEDAEQPNLTGQWRTAKGSVFTLIDNGTRVSLYLASSLNLELVDAELVRDDKGLLHAMYWFAVFKDDPGKELRALRMQGRIKNGRIILHGDECIFHRSTVRTSTMKRDPILTRVTATTGKKDGAEVPVAELRLEQHQIEETWRSVRRRVDWKALLPRCGNQTDSCDDRIDGNHYSDTNITPHKLNTIKRNDASDFLPRHFFSNN